MTCQRDRLRVIWPYRRGYASKLFELRIPNLSEKKNLWTDIGLKIGRTIQYRPRTEEEPVLGPSGWPDLVIVCPVHERVVVCNEWFLSVAYVAAVGGRQCCYDDQIVRLQLLQKMPGSVERPAITFQLLQSVKCGGFGKRPQEVWFTGSRAMIIVGLVIVARWHPSSWHLSEGYVKYFRLKCECLYRLWNRFRRHV